MAITLKHLKALSEECNFDYSEARRFLGHDVYCDFEMNPRKFMRDNASGKAPQAQIKSPQAQPKVLDKTLDKSHDKSPPKTGYHLFMSEKKASINSALKKQHGDSVPRGAFMKEASTQWKALTEKTQKSWKDKVSQ